jgi:hypothetical protein
MRWRMAALSDDRAGRCEGLAQGGGGRAAELALGFDQQEAAPRAVEALRKSRPFMGDPFVLFSLDPEPTPRGAGALAHARVW